MSEISVGRKKNTQDVVYLLPLFQPKAAFSIESKKGNALETESQLESTLFYPVVYAYHEL